MYRHTRKTPHTGNSRTFTSPGALVDLLDIRNVLNDLQIPFFLEYGTLLGVIRDHDFIDGDLDIDLGILNCPKRELILDRLDELGFYERTTARIHRSDPKFLSNDHFNVCVNRNVVIDIRLYRIGPGRYIDYYVDALGYYAWPKEFATFMEIDFKGNNYLIQKDYERFLEWNFSDTWRIPENRLSRAAGVFGQLGKARRGGNNVNEWKSESMRIANEWYENYKKR